VTKDRSPNWTKWKHIPDVMLWQAVALSLNVDPDLANRSYSWKAEGTVTGESKEFKDRLDVLLANFGRARLLKPTSLSLSDPEEATLRVDAFAAWAMSIGWSIPSDLAALSIGTLLQQPTLADPERWKSAQLWTLLEASYLLSSTDPPVVQTGVIKYIATPMTDEDLQLENLVGMSARIYREIKDATDLGQLEFVESRTGGIGNRRVEPAKCINWALGRGLQVPECFIGLATHSAKTAERPSLLSKEKESLLKLVIAMAIRGYGYDPRAKRSETTSEILGDIVECGLSLDAGTVKKWLEAGAELVDPAILPRLIRSKQKANRKSD
jgi:hypothetical protein